MSWGRNVQGPKCLGAEMSGGRNVQVPKRPWGRNVRVPKRPWGRNVQGPKRLGAETSRCRNVLGAETSACRNVLGAETSRCQNVLGAETFGPKRPLPKFFGPKPDEAAKSMRGQNLRSIKMPNHFNTYGKNMLRKYIFFSMIIPT